jgi:hypothetical protein
MQVRSVEEVVLVSDDRIPVVYGRCATRVDNSPTRTMSAIVRGTPARAVYAFVTPNAKLMSFYADVMSISDGIAYELTRGSFRKRRFDRPRVVVFTSRPDPLPQSLDDKFVLVSFSGA